MGKTVITLSAINDLMFDSFTISRVLVIGPKRVISDTWPAEIRKWDHLRNLDYAIAAGTVKQRVSALNASASITLLSRDNIKWLVEYYARYNLPWDFDMVVIDELSSFKSHQSQRFKALRSVRPRIRRIVGLTGTPSSNGLMDLWAEIGILDQGQRLGRFIGRYREAYFKVGSMNPQNGIVFKYVPRAGAEEQIYQKISDITISMKALDYLDMPEIVYNHYEVELSERERRLYDQLESDLLIPFVDGDVDAANAVALSNKLLQMANGAVYDENKAVRKIHNRKLEALEDLIESANGQNVLIAYWFKHDRERILAYLSSHGYSPADIRSSADIRSWNAGSIPIALIHPASAGHGLNIQQGGHILIWFGLTWSLELYQQTNARLWRQGQQETVIIQHIMVRHSIDEKVMRALVSKDASQERLIVAVRASIDDVQRNPIRK
ncbi:MAG: DEAD/DEAH box helicase [Sphaerochaeta sp.]|nr:DEAD/DEAH box helicase [Sphaerochaeta sp.]